MEHRAHHGPLSSPMGVGDPLDKWWLAGGAIPETQNIGAYSAVRQPYLEGTFINRAGNTYFGTISTVTGVAPPTLTPTGWLFNQSVPNQLKLEYNYQKAPYSVFAQFSNVSYGFVCGVETGQSVYDRFSIQPWGTTWGNLEGGAGGRGITPMATGNLGLVLKDPGSRGFIDGVYQGATLGIYRVTYRWATHTMGIGYKYGQSGWQLTGTLQLLAIYGFQLTDAQALALAGTMAAYAAG